MELPGNEVSQKFDEIKTGIFRAIDFLKTELNIYSLKLLPMENILVVLATFFASSQKQPLNFIQGTTVSLQNVLSQGNRNEFHHIFPKSYLKKLEIYEDNQINCLANFAIISRTDNKKISDQSPNQYKSLMPNDQTKLQSILSTHFCDLTMFEDDYNKFLQNRSEVLFEFAKELCVNT